MPDHRDDDRRVRLGEQLAALDAVFTDADPTYPARLAERLRRRERRDGGDAGDANPVTPSR